MKKIICFDGVDASGKTTLINAFQMRLAQEAIAYDVFNRNNPMINHLLWKTDKRFGVKSPPYAKSLYRFTRLHIAISHVIVSNCDIFLFDRNVLDVIVRAKMNKVEDSFCIILLEDMLKRLENIQLFTVLLNPSLNVVYERLNSRKLLSENEKHTEFLETYHNLCNEIFPHSPYLGKRMAIDTDKYSVEESVQKVWDFVSSEKSSTDIQ